MFLGVCKNMKKQVKSKILTVVSFVFIRGYVLGPSYKNAPCGSKHPDLRVLIDFFLLGLHTLIFDKC